jgi:hypothetical protein
MSAAERALLRELVQSVPPPSGGKPRRRRGKAVASQETLKLSVALPAELAATFRGLCKAQGRRQRRVLEELVRAYVAQHGHLL